ncbi:hypothetical protein F2Q70_00008477 [Brassica cretica]|uniref:Uncharacterized protein n=1 Tax=Brassica cretica TaxID=69181 RepID=A0A8S9LV28_BRACR|nr:hypothetical protein F2Q70_00008477 [Brassica cretica]
MHLQTNASKNLDREEKKKHRTWISTITVKLISSRSILGKLNLEWFNSTMWSAPPPPLSFNDDDGSVPLLRPPQLPQNDINISGGNGNSGVPSAEDFFPPSSSLSGGQLSKKVINMKELRSLALQSLPNSPGIHSTIWKVFEI